MRTSLAIALGLAAAAPAAAHEVRFTNLTPTTIWRLYVSPAGAGDWGPDQLVQETTEPGRLLGPGGTFTLDLGPQGPSCPFDVKAVFTDDETAMRFDVDLCAIDDFYFRPEG